MLASNIFLLASLLTTAATAPLAASPGDIHNVISPRWALRKTIECTEEDAQRAGCLGGCDRYYSSGVVCKHSERAERVHQEQMRSSASTQERDEGRPMYFWGTPGKGIQSVTPGH
ncbi:unnamed protein product [Clonostachys rosea f. rosea IK726]|jgi:hypothetical protein|uniref:Uncharacterized protein n=1 Tax=Clonostachys rosea f. rosea IK726 TaxID=1349383 RepID=A0ACA9TMH6_BIOOC|nr:unnamed protein product [Clonostachys rosea f. rosea IK726]